MLLACLLILIGKASAQEEGREFVIVNLHANTMNYFSLDAQGNVTNSNVFDPQQHIWHFIQRGSDGTVLYNVQGFYLSRRGNKITVTDDINSAAIVTYIEPHLIHSSELGGYLRFSNTWTFNGSAGSQGVKTGYEIVTTLHEAELTEATILETASDLTALGTYTFTHSEAFGRVAYSHYHFIDDDGFTGFFITEHYYYIKDGIYGDYPTAPDDMTFTYEWALDDNAEGYATINSTTGEVTLTQRPEDDYVFTILTLKVESNAPYQIYTGSDQMVLRIAPPMWINMVTSFPSDGGYLTQDNEVIISTNNGLAWLISVVNGYNGCVADDMAGKTIKLTSDVDMDAYIWTPIGENGHHFKGTFDGCGAEITGIRCQLTGQNATGLFAHVDGGVVKNTFVTISDLKYKGHQPGHIGILVDTLSNGAVLHSSEAAGTLEIIHNNILSMGGLVGLADAGAKVHSSMSVSTLKGYHIGGAVGTLSGGSSLRNSFTNNVYVAKIHSDDFAGGLAYNVADSESVKNCYVRVKDTETLTGFDVFVKIGSVSDNNYRPLDFASSIGDAYSTTETPYMYAHFDNALESSGRRLLDCLNEGVDAASGEASWMRTTAGPGNGSNINDDYPVLMLADFNAMGSRNGDVLFYGEANHMLAKMDDPRYDLDIYRNAANITNDNVATLYINQDVAITHTSDLTAYVGITLDNSAGPNGANPSVGGTDVIDWHMFASPLVAAPLGIDYDGDNQTWPFSWATPEGMPAYGFYAETEQNGYFPSNTPYHSFDYYAFSEPDYHWINFKRNGNSHWHEDLSDPFADDKPDNHAHIDYCAYSDAPVNQNETSLIPGKGYLLTIDKETFFQSCGMLNKGKIGIPVTTEGAHLTGYNFLGNPYQSYLDFDRFAEANASLWDDATNYSYSYILLDEDQKGYVSYVAGTSSGAKAANRYINMHQGFFIIADHAGTAIFDNDMRSLEGAPDFRYDQQPAYPLVNLTVTDENGNCDNLVVEMNRPRLGGARKAHELKSGHASFYAHHADTDYAILFLPEEAHEVAIRFEADSDELFTLAWETQNGDFQNLYLIDNITGVEIDMNARNEYAFHASTTDFVSRFKMRFVAMNVEEFETEIVNRDFAFVNHGQLVVNGKGMLEVIDLQGRVLLHKNVSSEQNYLNLNGLSQGIFILRLMQDDKNVRQQKIVL